MQNGRKLSEEFFEGKQADGLTGSQANSLAVLREWSSVSLRTTIDGT